MSSKTKIFVLKQKELIYTIVFIVLAIIFIILMILLISGKNKKKQAAAPKTVYAPGVYTASVNLSGSNSDIRVIVDCDEIKCIDMISPDPSITSINPLIKASLEDLSTQIIQKNTCKNLYCHNDSKYTSLMLKDAIETAISKAMQ